MRFKNRGRKSFHKKSKSSRAHSLGRKTKRVPRYGVSRGGIRL